MENLTERVNRIQYIEPTNCNFDSPVGVGTIESTTRINNQYEDFCVVVDLEVVVYDRRSCGGLNSNDEPIKIVYTTKSENKTFFGGTDGKLTTNYTDINTVMGSEHNTVECLGLESLNISYQSWMYPEVTAKFVDVRGSSVMMQEEENLHGDASNKSMYKAFFTFPYPQFKLKVKGFYGKGATFYLTVEDVKISFDANSGNFVFDVKFIGMMYRIYTDMPMLYCCVAPYMPQGIDYWDTRVNTDKLFVFKQKDGSTSPMIRFPELISKIYSIESDKEMVDSKSEEASKMEILANTESALSDVSQIPFLIEPNAFLFDKTHDNKKIVVYVCKNDSEWEAEVQNIDKYAESVKKCDETFNTNYYNRIKSFHKSADNKRSHERVVLKKTANNEFNFEKIIDESAEYQSDIGKVAGYVKNMNGINEVCVYVLYIDNDDYVGLKNEIEKKIKNIDTQKKSITNRYKQEQEEIIEKILGFCPSVKNFYNLAFAHMDTFMHCYNDMLSTINAQIINECEERDPRTYGFGEADSNLSTDLIETIYRLPPFPAIYKKDTGSQTRTVEQWPEEIINGNKLIEVDFVKNLLMATKMYIEEIDKVREAVEFEQSSKKDGENSQSNEMSLASFIRLNNVDFILNSSTNPYISAKQLALSNSDDFLGTTIAILSTRLFIYLTCNNNGEYAAREAGKIEAINLYKAFGDKINSRAFIQFLKKYVVDGSDENGIYEAITSVKHSDISGAWDFSECDNCNKILFAENGGGYLSWKLYNNGGKNPMPATLSSLAKLKKDFVEKNFPKDGISYINTSSDMRQSNWKTYSIKNDGSYFKKYSENLRTEIEMIENGGQQQETDSEDNKSKAKLSILKPNEIDKLFKNYRTEIDVIPYAKYVFYGKNDEGKFKSKADSDDIKEVINGTSNKTSLAIQLTTNSRFYDNWASTFNLSNEYGKAYMFLMAFPWLQQKKSFLDDNLENGTVMKSKLLLEGAFFYRKHQLTHNNIDIIKLDASKKYVAALANQIYAKPGDDVYLYFRKKDDTNYMLFPWAPHYSSERGIALMGFFKDWVKNEFSKIMGFLFDPKLYSNFNEKKLNLELLTSDISETLVQNANSLQDFLRDTFLTTVSSVELYMTDKQPLLASSNDMKLAITGFKSALKELYADLSDKLEQDSNDVIDETYKQNASDPFKNKDIKLSTYITLKNLYDKWLANPYKGPSTWRYVNVDDPNSDQDSDFNSFVYVDSLYHDIGYQILANVNRVAEWVASCMPSSELNGSYGSSVQVSKSIFEYLSEIAQHTGGFLIALPQKIGVFKDDVASMFKAIPFESYDWHRDSSCFVYMYTYKPSEHLGTDQYVDDGILDLTAEEIKDTFSDDGYSIPAFGVTFAKQNQSFFKNLTLNTESTTITEASLAAASYIASKGSEAPKEMSFFGQDLYKVRTSYSYECSFEMMGNIQIMPLMYFQLNNVPFWRGAYMVIKVTHSITPGNMVTTVTGVRINKYALPISDGAVLRSGGANGSRQGDLYSTNNPLYQGQFVEDNTYVPQKGVAGTIDFDKTKVNNLHPLICITPAYGPNFVNKTASWKISYDLVENHIIKKLKGMKYKDGTKFNVQMCNKDGNHTTTNACLMSETEGFIKEFGKDAVISVVPRFNTGSSNYFKIFYGGKTTGGQIVATEDSKKLADFFAAEVRELIQKQSYYKEMTPGMMSSNQTSGVIVAGETKAVDYGPSLSCASVVTFNWFDAYPASEICRKALTRSALDKTQGYKGKNPQGRYYLSQGWLNSNEGKEAIATMHVNAIKKYVDSLQ